MQKDNTRYPPLSIPTFREGFFFDIKSGINRTNLPLLLLLFLPLLLPLAIHAQVITSLPPFPTINDSVVVIFDATQGDGGLAGFTGDVYAHTGVITDKSTSSTDWKYVIADWPVNLPKAKLAKIGADLWQLNIGNIRQYYGIPASEKVLKLAFVFRNSDGTRTGRATGGADIFLPLFEPGLTLVITKPQIEIPFGKPERSPVFAGQGDTLHITAAAVAIGTQISSMTLFAGAAAVAQTSDDTLKYDFIAANFSAGKNELKIVAQDTAGAVDSTGFIVMVNLTPANIIYPPGTVDGINYIDNSTITLSLFAPFKEFVYVIGDFNDWQVDTGFYMNRYEASPDSVRFWLTLENLDPNTEYAFQYLVDGDIRIADPYTEKVLDPWNDQFIDKTTYPNLKPYPEGKTAEIVSTFQINRDEYEWQVTDFARAAKEDLVIYELLIRDFIKARNYQTMIDTLGYLERLGVNAIHLMPVNEFDGNSSWGYNPAFYFAPDKYYGTQNALKRFIDACHARGSAVILDMVLHHSTGQSPFVRLYSSGTYGPPSSENPWFNISSPNTVFSFFEDMDHESAATKIFVDRVNAFWVREYKIDGYRFDFTKGFTNTRGDGGAYDAARIAILKRMADQLWAVDSTVYVILEHFADNREEIELSNEGMMLWGNSNYNYNEATMGYHTGGKSDFSWGYYGTRGWSQPNLLTYMESHDEERLMYKNLQYGNSSGSYSVKDLSTALDRIKLAATFFFTLPGPKLIWQFGELGYEVSIDNPCRVCEKPIRWDYFSDIARNKLYRTYRALLKLRRENEVFRSGKTEVKLWLNSTSGLKRIRLNHAQMSASIIGNFGVTSGSVSGDFVHRGWWYDYFSGDSINVTDPTAALALEAGEFHIYTDKRLARPDSDLITAVDEFAENGPVRFELLQNYPNPFNPATVISFQLPVNSRVKLSVYNTLGQIVRQLISGEMPAGRQSVVWDGRDGRGVEVASGVFVVRLEAGRFVKTMKMVKMK
jgi:glycosidase